jgi:hypothetical protein
MMVQGNFASEKDAELPVDPEKESGRQALLQRQQKQ